MNKPIHPAPMRTTPPGWTGCYWAECRLPSGCRTAGRCLQSPAPPAVSAAARDPETERATRPPKGAEVIVPTYPSGAYRYRYDGRGWLIFAHGHDDNYYRGSLVSCCHDWVWATAAFAEALARIATLESRLAEAALREPTHG